MRQKKENFVYPQVRKIRGGARVLILGGCHIVEPPERLTPGALLKQQFPGAKLAPLLLPVHTVCCCPCCISQVSTD